MKGVDTKVFVATVATILMAASSPSVSFPIADDNASSDVTASSFLDLQIDRNELERKEECCESCENQQDVSTMAYSGGGREGSSGTPQHGVRSPGWDDIDVNLGDFEQGDGSRNNDKNDHRAIRILTWAESKPELQAYADLYRQLHPDAPTVRIINVPSLKELDYEITSELRLGSTDFDGFVVPPLMMGGMLQSRSGQALAIWTKEEMISSTQHHEQQEPKSLLDDLLPYYRYNVATYGGSLRGLPILSGSQALLLFRKDYFDALNLPTPKTWEDWTIIASAFSDQKDLLLDAGPNESDEIVYGACLGLLNEAGCRRRNSLDGRLCKSQTMTYLGMVMASMTQYAGNSTGYMLGIDDASPNGLDPLFGPTLERVLKWMEKQVENSGPRSLTEDSFESMKHFRDGRCAWTISVDHDNELLKDDNIGFVPLPGSHQVLDRRASTKTASRTNSHTGAPDSMTNCTASCDRNCQQTGSAVLCPFGEDFVNQGRVNQVPFGAVDATIGTVSALVSRDRQEEAKEFFKFVLDSGNRQNETGVVETSYNRIQQPLTYSELEKSDVPNYVETMKSLTSSPNAAIPIRVPNAFNLLSNLDDRIYDYLVEGDYSDDRREQVAQAAEKSWHMMISMYNFRGPHNKQPTFVFHELSMGVNMPTPTLDLYIGWVARSVMWTLAGLSCVMSVYFALWVWTYQEERVIRASQPVFLYLICAGTLVMASSVFTLGIEDDIASDELTSVTCMASYWLYSLGFTAVISTMFSKMWMLGQVFRKPRNEQRIQIKKWDILSPFFVFFGLDCVVLSIWTILDRQQWVRVPVHSDPYSLAIVDNSTTGSCESEYSNWYIGLLLAFNIAVLVLSLVQSYECRRITTEYAESSWLTIGIATTAQAWFISLPLLMLLDNNPTTYFLLTSSTVLCTTFAILLLIFVPKMIYLYEALKKNKKVPRLSVEETGKKLFGENHEKFDKPIAGSVTSTRGSSQSTQRRQDPKGTIGIRIIQYTFLDSDEVDALEDALDFELHRNEELKYTMGRLKDNLEAHQFARNHLFSNSQGFSFKSNAHNSNTSIITSADISSIIEAKPENLRHSRLSRRGSYLS